MALDRSFIRYNGLKPLRAFGHDWMPAIGTDYRDIKLDSIFQYFKDRCPCNECGVEFANWLNANYIAKFGGKFEIHVDFDFYNKAEAVVEEAVEEAAVEETIVEEVVEYTV
jgi:hypothetical protein